MINIHRMYARASFRNDMIKNHFLISNVFIIWRQTTNNHIKNQVGVTS